MQQLQTQNDPITPAQGVPIEPPVPTEVNLESFPWAPVKLAFLTSHPLALARNAEPFRSLVLLISQAWRQQPAMSAPNDDTLLAAMAGFGRDVEAWLEVREPVMQGWILCSDGRWYHPELAAWALQSWEAKKREERFRAKQSERARARKPASSVSADESAEGGHGSAAAEPYKRGDEIEKIKYEIHKKVKDKKGRGDHLSPESGAMSSVGVDSMSMKISQASLKTESQEVDGEIDVEKVFNHWKQRTDRLNEKLTESRRKIIRARLNEGILAEQICRAIDNAAESDFYQGRTAKQSHRIDTLDVICKDADRILRLSSSVVGQSRSGKPRQAALSTAHSFTALLHEQDMDVTDVESSALNMQEGGSV